MDNRGDTIYYVFSFKVKRVWKLQNNRDTLETVVIIKKGQSNRDFRGKISADMDETVLYNTNSHLHFSSCPIQVR